MDTLRECQTDALKIADREFHSRLLVGTGKYRSFPEMARCHEASGAEVVTVAVRRVNLADRSKESLLDYIDRSKYFLLPNTAAVSPPRKPFAPPAWAAKRACPTG